MASKDYPEHLQRLETEQNRAIEDTKSQLNQWHKFKSDYQALQKRLTTLPDQLTHDVMVPFGKMAFMPGQLVHTNEILVLLGDNWFVDRSAKQASEIVDRRIKTVDEHLTNLEAQMRLLEPRREFTSELQEISKNSGEMLDIREEYNEATEQAWKERHKKSVQEHRRKLREENANNPRPDLSQNASEAETGSSDKALWDRLDQLEKIETRRREIQKVGTAAEERLKDFEFPVFNPAGNDVASQHSTMSTTERTISNKEQRNNDIAGASLGSDDNNDDAGSDDDNAGSDYESDELDSDDDDNDEGDEVVSTGSDDGGDGGDEVDVKDNSQTAKRTKRIIFSHSKTEANSTASKHDYPDNPGEIYQHYSKPKSILKQSSNMKKKLREKVEKAKVAFESASDDDYHVQGKPLRAASAPTAFSGTVQEKPVSELPRMPCPQGEPVTSNQKLAFKSPSTNRTSLIQTRSANQTADKERGDNDSSIGAQKPVSRFKAQRLNKN